MFEVLIDVAVSVPVLVLLREGEREVRLNTRGCIKKHRDRTGWRDSRDHGVPAFDTLLVPSRLFPVRKNAFVVGQSHPSPMRLILNSLHRQLSHAHPLVRVITDLELIQKDRKS